jgi:hypothetical protein
MYLLSGQQDFSLIEYTKTGENIPHYFSFIEYTKTGENIPHCH